MLQIRFLDDFIQIADDKLLQRSDETLHVSDREALKSIILDINNMHPEMDISNDSNEFVVEVPVNSMASILKVDPSMIPLLLTEVFIEEYSGDGEISVCTDSFEDVIQVMGDNTDYV